MMFSTDTKMGLFSSFSMLTLFDFPVVDIMDRLVGDLPLEESLLFDEERVSLGLVNGLRREMTQRKWEFQPFQNEVADVVGVALDYLHSGSYLNVDFKQYVHDLFVEV